MESRGKRQSKRPFLATYGNSITSKWATIAYHCIKNITVVAATKESYKVSAQLKNTSETNTEHQGEYSSATGVHGEMDVCEKCGTTFPNNKVLIVDTPPCKRCALILGYLMKDKAWTVKGPQKDAFHSDYEGAYHVPKNVLDYLLERLVADKIFSDAATAELYRDDILKLFLSPSVWLK